MATSHPGQGSAGPNQPQPSAEWRRGDDPPFRIGHGYDLHRLEPLDPSNPKSRQLVVGGVRLEHDRGPIAHSDGDALYHALTDALLGALALPDIGQLFPDNAEENDGRDSADFLRDASQKLAEQGWSVVNIDATVVLEAPRIGPHKQQMRENIARLVRVPLERVNIKGKTHEQLDAVGEGRAIEAHAVVMLLRR